MKRTDLKKHAAALLLVLCLLVTSALPALATSANIKLVDSSGNPTTGTIRVTLYDSANDKALSGGKLTLYRVAEVKRQNGNLSYEYCGDFYGCGIALYYSSRENRRPGEEYGSAKWGNPKELNRKYMDHQHKDANIILTQRVRLGMDGYITQRNMNVW